MSEISLRAATRTVCNPPREVRSHCGCIAFLILAAAPLAYHSAVAQDAHMVQTMAANEVQAHALLPRYFYVSEERSDRTGGHLWREKVVEVADGSLRRLIAVDGKPLDAQATAAEDRRIRDLVAHPDSFRRQNASRKDDEIHATQLLALLPKAFLLTPAGQRDGCMAFQFRPNPAFQPTTYEERVGHAMEGTVTVAEPAGRLCTLEGRIAQPVDFGFGLLGHVNQGGHFALHRKQIDATHWKSDRISVHIDGRILMLKTLARNQDAIRTDIRLLPNPVSLAQAAQMTQP